MAWIIESLEEPDLAWSNTFGWCSETYDTFSDEEKHTLNLPFGGHWVSVPWSIVED